MNFTFRDDHTRVFSEDSKSRLNGVLQPIQLLARFADQQHAFVFTIGEGFDVDRLSDRGSRG